MYDTPVWPSVSSPSVDFSRPAALRPTLLLGLPDWAHPLGQRRPTRVQVRDGLSRIEIGTADQHNSVQTCRSAHKCRAVRFALAAWREDGSMARCGRPSRSPLDSLVTAAARPAGRV